jgi:nucleotide-binding universal stress UspA family protein
MKILLAIDGAKTGTAALEMLRRLVIQDGDQIVLVSVVDLPVPVGMDIYGGYVPDSSDLEKNAKENASRALSDALESLKNTLKNRKVEISTELLFGSPESCIVELAEQIKPDLVVVGSHDYSAWERLLIGSVSDAVVHHSPCSVMVVRSPRS